MVKFDKQPTYSMVHRIPRVPSVNHIWRTSEMGGYITPTGWGIPTASQWGVKSKVPDKRAEWLHNPCRMGSPRPFTTGAESKVAHKWDGWLHNPCRVGVPDQGAGGKMRGGPQMGSVAKSHTPPWRSPPRKSRQQNPNRPTPSTWGVPRRLRTGGQSHRWPTSGLGGYIVPATSGVPTASQ